MALARFGVSMDEEILKALDAFVIENKLSNRSQAIRHLVEKNLAEKKWKCNQTVAGAVVMLYDHHRGEITTRSNDIQHNYHDVILSSQHFHLDNDNCLEIVAVKGEAKRLTELSDKLIGIKGIIHGKLVMSRAD
ncbi:MAG TPA: nickel-responsive transcriptional regulator NikR [Bacteroidales bacterium]|mgnify:CR=1 FL=1|nr:nickel-responsive transcriptional regulator NikR [Bacteroidales bacterium]HPJ59782.1 nickel-responsive transcriptional regulator NikR [Bacteroidales bacterium]HPR12555.1 nickel-responsive transcriptional regulator NikR [Bacteroidales bacterium]HRW85238.1 nickel-responsive transcriptional regulator NikR [Bacteroidales bacterium]